MPGSGVNRLKLSKKQAARNSKTAKLTVKGKPGDPRGPVSVKPPFPDRKFN